MNVITTTNGLTLMSSLATAMGGLEGLRDDVRTAEWALGMARNEVTQVRQYRGADVAYFRNHLARRLWRLLTALRQAKAALREAQEISALRRAQAVQPAALTAKQISYCITKLTHVEAWLDRLSLSKPADDDYHARLLMRNEVSWIRDLLANAAIQPVSLIKN